MKRGVIQLTKTEAYEAVKLFPESQQESPLCARLKAAQDGESEFVDLQVSDEELEVLLDNAGLPERDEVAELGSLRVKVKEYLNTLRE